MSPFTSDPTICQYIYFFSSLYSPLQYIQAQLMPNSIVPNISTTLLQAL